jgi:hypothetical protein
MCVWWGRPGITIFGALPVAILVKSPEVLALVSQASVGFVFFFTTIVAVLAFSPVVQAGMALSHGHKCTEANWCLP